MRSRRTDVTEHVLYIHDFVSSTDDVVHSHNLRHHTSLFKVAEIILNSGSLLLSELYKK
jgi:hypothetical protein